MKKLILTTLALILTAVTTSFASDPRETAILTSPMVKAIQKGLKQEQRLKCVATYDESGELTVNYLIEDHLSKFELFLSCGTEDGTHAVIKGILGDGGQTKVESFRLQAGVN